MTIRFAYYPDAHGPIVPYIPEIPYFVIRQSNTDKIVLKEFVFIFDVFQVFS